MPVERLRSFTLRLTEDEANRVAAVWIESQSARPALDRLPFTVWLRQCVLNVCRAPDPLADALEAARLTPGSPHVKKARKR